jgi:putative polyhydroxyalkanoate system protein
MAKFTVAKQHRLTHKKAKDAAQKVADDLKRRFDLNYEWHGDSIEFHRPGLKGKMVVGKDEVHLDCELGFVLSMLRPVLEAEIDKEFNQRFGSA